MRTGRPKTNKFSLMTESEMLIYLQERYDTNGISSLSYVSIKKEKGLYFHLYNKGLTTKTIIKKLGLEQAYKEFKTDNFTKTLNGKVHRRWSWERIIDEASPIVKEKGFLPPAQWFQQNKMGSLVFSVYNFGKTWNDLRSHFGSYENSDFVESRNGMRWRSHPEASFSNFLYARGIEHKTGKKYPDEYAEYGDASYGYYDLHFKSIDNDWIDVEVWGDKPNGHNESGYKKTRVSKELFNKNNCLFLGISYSDCYDEDLLELILKPYIGNIPPFQFDKPTDKIIQPTHWSNADELITHCKEIAKLQPGGVFPTEEWLRKRGKWKDREGPTYNTVSIYIKTWIGGVRKLREILGQSENSTIQWNRTSALQAYKDFYDKHGATPGQARTMFRNGDEAISEEVAKQAANLCSAVSKYAEGEALANKHHDIIINRRRKWTRDSILSKTKLIIEEWGMSPRQLLHDHKSGLCKLELEEYKSIVKMLDAVGRQFNGIQELYDMLDFRPYSRPRNKK